MLIDYYGFDNTNHLGILWDSTYANASIKDSAGCRAGSKGVEFYGNTHGTNDCVIKKLITSQNNLIIGFMYKRLAADSVGPLQLQFMSGGEPQTSIQLYRQDIKVYSHPKWGLGYFNDPLTSGNLWTDATGSFSVTDRMILGAANSDIRTVSTYTTPTEFMIKCKLYAGNSGWIGY